MAFILRILHLCLGITAFFAVASSPAFAQRTTVKIQGFFGTAGNAFMDSDSDTLELDEGVDVIYQNQSITCKRAHISLRSKKFEAEGQVRIKTPSATIGGEHIILDYENGTGIIYGGFVQSGNVVFEGEILQKVSETEYYVVKADYTACTNCPASWKFSGSSIRAELGGYAYIKNSVIRSGPVPVFWLPYLVVPLKSDRQSGLLTPEFEQTDTGGTAIALTGFWAISKNTDATFSLKNYEKRGLKGLVEYRYVLDEFSNGQLNYATITDQAFYHEDRYTKHRATESARNYAVNRWFLKYNHYQELPENYVSRVQLNNASDLQYSKDFYKETQIHGDPAMENRVSISKNTEDKHFSIDGSYYINMLHADPMASNDDAVHRLPEIRYSQVSKYIGDTPYLYTFDLNYVNFTRSSKAYDDLGIFTDPSGKKIRYLRNTSNNPNWENQPNESPTNDGYYDPYVDLIRTGQRVDIYPTIYRTYSFANAVDVTPRLGYRETHYLFPDLPVKPGVDPVDTTNVRRYVRAEIGAKTSISNIYGPQNELRSTLWKHEIQPEIIYTRLPWVDHRAHPFFGFSPDQAEAPYFTQRNLTDDDLGLNSGVQFDYNDRVYDRNLLTYAVTNRFVQKRWHGNDPEYRQVGLLRLSQSYDVYLDENSNDPNKEPWSDISMFMDVRLDNFGILSTTNYYPYQKVSNTNSSIRLIDDKGRFIQTGLILKYNIVPGQSVDLGARQQDYSLSAGLLSSHLDFIGTMTIDGTKSAGGRFDQFDKTIKSYSYIAQYKPPGDCIALRFSFQQVIGGDNQTTLNLLFSFDGKGPQPLSIENLNELRI
jgi:LPS-assembly protein